MYSSDDISDKEVEANSDSLGGSVVLNELETLVLVDVELLKLVDPLAEILSDLDSLVDISVLSLCELLTLVVDSEVLLLVEVE